MKRKVLAMMMSLTLAMAVTACGGSDTETDAADTAVEETVDDTAEADEAEAGICTLLWTWLLIIVQINMNGLRRH